LAGGAVAATVAAVPVVDGSSAPASTVTAGLQDAATPGVARTPATSAAQNVAQAATAAVPAALSGTRVAAGLPAASADDPALPEAAAEVRAPSTPPSAAPTGDAVSDRVRTAHVEPRIGIEAPVAAA